MALLILEPGDICGILDIPEAGEVKLLHKKGEIWTVESLMEGIIGETTRIEEKDLFLIQGRD